MNPKIKTLLLLLAILIPIFIILSLIAPGKNPSPDVTGDYSTSNMASVTTTPTSTANN